MSLDTYLNTVTCIDALALLDALPPQSVSLLLIDPPYGLAGRVFSVPEKHFNAINEEWDNEVPTSWMPSCRRILKPRANVICFGGRQSIYKLAHEGIRLGWHLVNDITWVKPDAPPCFTGRNLTETTERLLWFCPDGNGWTYNLEYAKHLNDGMNFRDVWQFGIYRSNRVHPAQKPIALFERCIELFSKPNDIVLDCFAGSGTTGVAARNCGRQYILGDTSEEYCAIARDRLRLPFEPRAVTPVNDVSDLPLFAAQGETGV